MTALYATVSTLVQRSCAICLCPFTDHDGSDDAVTELNLTADWLLKVIDEVQV